MIVPRFWAEGRVREHVEGHQVTLRRFGWSDISQADAQALADRRTLEALDQFKLGDRKLPRREKKVPYNGADGVPIREEIVAVHGDSVITRNSYGAHCLNTPDVLFADIDFDAEPSCKLISNAIGVACLAWLTVAYLSGRWMLLLAGIVVIPILGAMFAHGYHRLSRWVQGGPEKLARKRLRGFLRTHPEWHIRLYRSPAGFRILAMHRTFSPGEPIVAEFFRYLGVDPTYVSMCQHQQCFRARLTAKPWRIGLPHMRPRPGTWPVKPERIPERNEWITTYEAKAQMYAACSFVEAVGPSSSVPATQTVQQLHDQLAKATSGLPIA